MTYWTALLIGLIFGAAGFLPVSASGHLSFLHNLLRIGDLPEHPLFDALLRLAACAAVMLTSRTELRALRRETLAMTGLRALPRGRRPDRPMRRMIQLLLLAALPLIAAAILRSVVRPLYEHQIEFNYLEDRLLTGETETQAIIAAGAIDIGRQHYTILLIEDLERRLADIQSDLPDQITINLNGCPNACARTQVADIGLKGQMVTDADGNQVPGFQVHLGGGLALDAGFGRKIRGHKVTSAELGDYVERVVRRYVEQRTGGERFAQWVARAEEADLK